MTDTPLDRALTQLNPTQRQAVESDDGPCSYWPGQALARPRFSPAAWRACWTLHAKGAFACSR